MQNFLLLPTANTVAINKLIKRSSLVRRISFVKKHSFTSPNISNTLKRTISYNETGETVEQRIRRPLGVTYENSSAALPRGITWQERDKRVRRKKFDEVRRERMA